MHSGQVLLGVNDDPIVLLATSIPLWRDISLGDKGDDVRALQSELQRLGYSYHGTPGVAGAGTISAARQLLHAAGDGSVVGQTVPASQFAWIPAPAVTIASCPVAVGASVESGNSLATLDGSLTRASIVQLPADLVPGERLLEINAVAVPIAAGGVVTDSASLAKIASTDAYAQYVASSASGTPAVTTDDPNASGDESSTAPAAGVSAKLVLTHTMEIGVVPPSAVYSISANKGCVLGPQRAYAVSVVGSQLGQTYVRFTGNQVPARVLITPKKTSPCR
jgi:peptidoglycan hydrolase-like protein with peptidoglycan-binding domain